MNRIARRLIAVFLMVVSSLVYADSLVNQIQGLITPAPTVRGKFRQIKSLSGVSKNLNSEGFFIVDKSQGVVWVTEKPIYQILKVSDSGIRIGNKDGVLMSLGSRNEPSVKFINELVLAIFSGEMSALDKLFNISGDVTAKSWSLELTPRNISSTPFRKITIGGSATISLITFTSKDGDITEVTFSDVRLAPLLSKDEALKFQ